MYSCYIQSFKILASFCSWAGWFESYLSKIPEDTFSRDVAHLNSYYKNIRFYIEGNDLQLFLFQLNS